MKLVKRQIKLIQKLQNEKKYDFKNIKVSLSTKFKKHQ